MKFFAMAGPAWGVRTPEDDETARRRLAKTLRNPQNWFQSARRLTFAMRQLEPSIAHFWEALANQGTTREKEYPIPDIECLSVYLMLAGLAIENLCKGHFVSQLRPDEEATLSAGKLPPRLDQQHRIIRLVSDTGLLLSESENELLTRVQDSIQWLGRYPAPKSFKYLVNEINAAGDVEQIGNFLARLQTHVAADFQF
jgi:hypothetical protein